MLRIDGYFYRNEEDPKIILTMDWFVFEDHWSQRYMFDHPLWDEEMMERMRVSNLARCKWFRISLNLFHYKVNFDIKLKHIANVYYGRQMNDFPEPSRIRRKKEQQEIE